MTMIIKEIDVTKVAHVVEDNKIVIMVEINELKFEGPLFSDHFQAWANENSLLDMQYDLAYRGAMKGINDGAMMEALRIKLFGE